MTGFEEPRHIGESAALPLQTPPSQPMDALDTLISRVSSKYKDTPGVHGVGRGFGRPNRDAIVIFVDNGGVAESLPKEIEGYPVVVEVVQGGFNIDW
jgi:hypothetical protein